VSGRSDLCRRNDPLAVQAEWPAWVSASLELQERTMASRRCGICREGKEKKYKLAVKRNAELELIFKDRML
jgi:hypothetical protein